MKVNNVSNIGFGIRCIKSEKWNKEVYNSLKKSNLAKEIDKKYPEASANYFLYKQNDLVNDEPVHTVLFDLNLDKDKIWHFWLNSHSENSLTQYLSKNLKELTLEKIEADIAKGTKTLTPVKIKINTIEENIVIKFFKKVFNIN